MNQLNIESFLKFGYFLDFQNPSISFDFSQVNKNKYKNYSEAELIYKASELFINSIEQLFEKNKNHVVPLSGGLDSRAILAVLLEFTEADNIYTYTFGTPGTLDFEIGNQIANIAGTNHINFPLTKYYYKLNELIDISKRISFQTVLFHHPPIWELDQFFRDYIHWPGFFGGQLVGDDYIETSPIDIVSGKKMFIKEQSYQNEVNLNSVNDSVFYSMLDIEQTESQISVIELLNFYNRQLKFIAPHVLIEGFDYRTPFLNEKLFNFFLSIGDEYRRDRILFKKVVLKTFPNLFLYPVKNNYGLSLTSPKLLQFIRRIYNKAHSRLTNKNVYINYLDFDVKIREKKDLQEIIKENIYDLHDRKIIDWLDVRKIYQDHIYKKGNFGNALLLLSSLEIHMKAMELNNRKNDVK